MTQEPRDPEVALRHTLEAFWKVAHETCAEIEAFQPDLVVALYHGGQAPLRATIALWQETRPAPFPPVLYTNLGREKLARYDRMQVRRKPLGFSRGMATCRTGTDVLLWTRPIGRLLIRVPPRGVHETPIRTAGQDLSLSFAPPSASGEMV